MPEEQAFCVLVRLMYDYKLRNLYKDGFENLNLKLFQLSRLLEVSKVLKMKQNKSLLWKKRVIATYTLFQEKEPHLWQHFTEQGIETHMFASHWFLTLYTARFPLYFVFYILDVVLVQGLDTLFQIALSLIVVSQKLTFCRKLFVLLYFLLRMWASRIAVCTFTRNWYNMWGFKRKISAVHALIVSVVRKIIVFFVNLQSSKKELLTLDFENILKYFQVTLPKKCRNQWTAKKIITRACNIKLKKLKKYEHEFMEMKSKRSMVSFGWIYITTCECTTVVNPL